MSKRTSGPSQSLVPAQRYAPVALRRIAVVAVGGALAIGVLMIVGPPVVEWDEPLQAATPVEARTPTALPETPLSLTPRVVEQTGLIEPVGIAKPLKLFAVYPSGSPSVGRAVLGAAEASSRTYVVGALLENGARLVEVYGDRAVLAREGRNYTLRLPGSGGSDDLSSETAALTVGAFPPPQSELEPPVARITDVLRTVPAYNGESIVGFSAYPGERRDQFEKWGLQAGDVLLSAGGYPLNDLAQMEAVVERLEAGAVLTAAVSRASGERGQVTLDGSVLMATTPPGRTPLPIR